MKIQFGRYKNQDIEEVPDDYLEWLLQKCQQNIILIQHEQRRRKIAQESMTDLSQEPSDPSSPPSDRPLY